MTEVRGKLVKPDGSAVVGASVVAHLVAPSAWLKNNAGDVVAEATTVTGSDGSWSLNLTDQTKYEMVDGFYVIREGHAAYAVSVPAAGPVDVSDIRVDPTTLTPTEPVPPSLYLARAEMGQPGGVAPLDTSGKVPATNLPVGNGGTVEGAHIWFGDGSPTVVPGAAPGDIYIDELTGIYYQLD